MKKTFFIILSVLFACSVEASAQSFLSKLFGTSGKSTANTEETTTSSSTATDASSALGNVLGNIASSVGSSSSTAGTITNVLTSLLGNSVTLSEDLLKGTWNYNGSACILESDAALANIGGTVVTSKIEEKLDTYLAKVGVKEGSSSFTFSDENVCTFKIGSKEITGTYTLNAEEKTINFVFYNTLSMTAHVAYELTTLNVVFNADKMLNLVQKVLGTVADKGSSLSALGSSSTGAATTSTLSTISSLLNNYEGMMLGMKMSK